MRQRFSIQTVPKLANISPSLNHHHHHINQRSLLSSLSRIMSIFSFFIPKEAPIYLQGERSGQEQGPKGEAGVLGRARGHGRRRQRARGARARGRGNLATTIAAARGGRYRHGDHGHAAGADGARDCAVVHACRVERRRDLSAAGAGVFGRGALHRVVCGRGSGGLGVVFWRRGGRCGLVVGGGDRSGDHDLCLGFGLGYGAHGSADGHDLRRHGSDRAVRHGRRALSHGGGTRRVDGARRQRDLGGDGGVRPARGLGHRADGGVQRDRLRRHGTLLRAVRH